MSAPDRPARRRPLQWFNPFGRALGMWAYVGMRISGLGLVLYLFVHLTILKQLADGPAAWDGFVALAKTPLFLLLDVVLIAAIVAHGLNGLRVALVGFGIGVPAQKTMLVIAGLLSVVLTALSAYAIFFLVGG